MRKFSLIALLVVAFAGNARAQGASIDPGMTREQVIAKLGKPISEHTSGSRTYLYYSNGDEKKYGMHDFVMIEDGKVADAVFRSEAHKYSGKSSSPAPVSAEAAIAKGHGGHVPPKPAPVERKPEPPAEKKAPPMKKEVAPVKKAEAPTKKEPPPVKKAEPPTTKKAEPPATKKAEPPATKKAAPPATKLHEPLKNPDTKKIAPPDTGKKSTPAPTKKP